jgi:hypothetical protein
MSVVVKVKESLKEPNLDYVSLYRRLGERPFVDHWVELANSLGSNPIILEIGCGTTTGPESRVQYG